ncbi:surface-adhesin E family protein [Ferruginibacter albus]|uniref:surface-adhesin E family protein n=1 Tax=Ferruginibacter albus TaxID=2875540 RepID=UPI001CC6A2D2|nr:surface-adhesin E family protein [Ferruginibacter albus]UAY52137.1 hypothetical protein K9M53_00235 [Ferruginibacter albus]
MKMYVIMVFVFINATSSYSQSRIRDTTQMDTIASNNAKTTEYKPTPSDERILDQSVNIKWRYSTSSNTNERWYFKTTCISNYNGVIKIWLKAKSSSEVINGKTYKNIERKVLISFDCSAKTVTNHAIYTYDSQGKIIDSDTQDYTEPQDIVPGSVLEKLQEDICYYYSD